MLDLQFINKILSLMSVRGVGRLRRYFRHFIPDDYNMDGYVVFSDGTRKTFTVDSADAPYLFDSEKLNSTDTYFKIQCPIDLGRDSFALTDSINIPWSDHKHADPSLKKLTARGERLVIKNFSSYVHKIKPLMIGPRRLSRAITYRGLNDGFQNYISSRNLKKSAKFMCYFGNAQGPAPEQNVTRPDYDWERDIMGFHADQVSHPNEKRAKIAEFLQTFGADTDARVISIANADSGVRTNPALIVPLEDFCRHIANFQYNFNVSGYRMSIPSRFIESFIVGTRIITDKLKVKWYLPFDECEVFETVEMGYKKMDQVDWPQFERDVQNLPETEPEKIIECFNRKWQPSVVAQYMIDTLRQKENA